MAITSESAWAQAHLVDQGGVEEELGELIQQRLGIECLSSYCLFINDLTVWILPRVARVHKGVGVKLGALRKNRGFVSSLTSKKLFCSAWRASELFCGVASSALLGLHNPLR